MKQGDKSKENRGGERNKHRKGKGIRRTETAITNQRVGFEKDMTSKLFEIIITKKKKKKKKKKLKKIN